MNFGTGCYPSCQSYQGGKTGFTDKNIVFKRNFLVALINSLRDCFEIVLSYLSID